MGRILDALEASGLSKKTLVIFTSDHGEEFYDHGWYNHGGGYYEELVRIPLILAGPGIPKDRRIDTIVSHIDLMPAVADLLGMDAGPLDFQGRSLLQLIKGNVAGFQKRPLMFEGGQGYALLHNDYKIYLFKDKKELYSLKNDPGEKSNLAMHSSNLLEQMTEQLESFRKQMRQERKKRGQALDEEVLKKIQEETLEQMEALGYIN